MAEPIESKIFLRSRYEHFKSTPEFRRTYTVLGIRALKDEVVVLYVADFDSSKRVYEREISNFCEDVKVAGERQERFSLLERYVITGIERDALLHEYQEIDE